MTSVIVTGRVERAGEVIAGLLAHGLTLVPLAWASYPARRQAPPAELILLLVDEAGVGAELLDTISVQGLPWLVWDMGGGPLQVRALFQAGALSVLPAEAGLETLLRALQQLLSGGRAPHQPIQGEHLRRYRRGERIVVTPESVLEVQNGIVALVALHSDGTEVLLGLAGAGQLVLDHPEDSCYLQLMAQTDVVVEVRPWLEASSAESFAPRLRERLRQMEAWAAMQARPYLDQRLLGILSLLAEQFGVPHPHGTLVDVRITHLQLASAVGATRTTITRIVRNLRTRGLLSLAETAEGERFCIQAPEHAGHVHGAPPGR